MPPGRGPLTRIGHNSQISQPETMRRLLQEVVSEFKTIGCGNDKSEPQKESENMAKQYITNAPDWSVIKTYFTQTDIQHMLQVSQGSIDLSSCSSVLANAQLIYQHVSGGTPPPMPPGNPWPAAWIN